MSKQTHTLYLHELLSNYIREKAVRNLGDFVTPDEFLKYTEELSQYLDANEFLGRRYEIENGSFPFACQAAIASPHTNLDGEELMYQDGRLIATYQLELRDTTEEITPGHVRDFLRKYIANQSHDRDQVSQFSISELSAQQEQLVKRASAYIVQDLMRRYIANNMTKKQWPVQCGDWETYILQKDLASFIDLEGTREAFLDIYANATKVLGQLLSEKDDFSVSNDRHHCLAFSHFLNIIGTFSFAADCCYNWYDDNDTPINIRFANGTIELTQNRIDENAAVVSHSLDQVDYSAIDALSNGVSPSAQKIKTT